MVSQQSGLILDTIGEGICITDGAGKILWSNRRIKQWPEEVRQRIQQVCHEAWERFTLQTTPAGNGPTSGSVLVGQSSGESMKPITNQGRSRKFSFDINDSQFFEMFCSPVVDSHSRCRRLSRSAGIQRVDGACSKRSTLSINPDANSCGWRRKPSPS